MLLERIKALCNKKNIKIKSMEKELGLGNGTIGKWKTTSPSADNLYAVANYLGTTMEYLMGVEPEKTE